MFWISEIGEGGVRGDHAHRQCHQLIVAMAGRFKVSYEEGPKVKEAFMNEVPFALYLPPLTWVTISDLKPNSVVFVLASDEYDLADYITDKEEYLKLWAEHESRCN